MAEIHPDITHPTSVTHFLCPAGPKDRGNTRPAATHHLVPRRTGNLRWGHALQQHVCTYCEKTERQLREETGLA